MDYELHKKRSREREAEKTRSGQDIGPPHEVVDPARRADSFNSLRCFCESYFPSRFALAWSPDHLQVLARMQEAICHGGLFALAMPRGSGKTTICEAAALWAVLTGRHAFVMLLAVSGTRADQLLASIKTELLANDLLDEDWPEVTHPVRSLEDRANRAKGQHIEGKQTHIAWRTHEIVLPTVAGSVASGAVLRVAGITSGSIRGPKYTRHHDGRSVRPSLAILDDPQDDKSARSAYQCARRHSLIHGAVLGMAGPGARITALMPCTVIEQGDLADQMLSRDKSPLWTGQRYQLLDRMPERMDLWEEYRVKRADEFRNDGNGSLASAWYAQNKTEMDRGAVASWPERFNENEHGPIHHAMNLWCQDEIAFWSEYQNQPMLEEPGSGQQLKDDELVKRVNGLPRGVVPLACTRVVCYIDVHKNCLFWLVVAWSEGFTGSVIDYGTYPDQQRRYFTLNDARRTLQKASPGTGLETAIFAGLDAAASHLGGEWKREDGVALKIERMIVDANWGPFTDTVYAWCRQTPYAAIVMPAHGQFKGPESKPWSEYQKRPGERLGNHWLIPVATGKRAIRYVLIDTNHWKSFIAERLLVGANDKGALTLYGKAGQDHAMLADHLTAEYRTPTTGRGRTVDIWKPRPERTDNHWFDCLVGCAVAASMQGVELGSATAVQAPQPIASAKSDRQAYEERRRAFEARRGF